MKVNKVSLILEFQKIWIIYTRNGNWKKSHNNCSAYIVHGSKVLTTEFITIELVYYLWWKCKRWEIIFLNNVKIRTFELSHFFFNFHIYQNLTPIRKWLMNFRRYESFWLKLPSLIAINFLGCNDNYKH